MIGATSISKNAIGIVGVLIMISIAAIPLIKALILLLMFQVANAITEPFVDQRISKCFLTVCDSSKALVGMLAMISMMFIISTTFLVKMSNFSLMYR